MGVGMKRAAAAALVSALLAGGVAMAAQIPIAGDPVQTASGLVAGTRLPSGVKAYFGIPFAKPPVNDLRWRAPQPISWDGVWNADRKGPECIQVLRPHDINHYFGEEATSEDCLYMNIWAPGEAKAGDKRPVIVFIYGGGSTIGSSGMGNYDGENMAKRGAIFVNFNYRVGLMGFMAHPELTAEQGGHSGNYAYLDQNAALKWIQANIAKFGGDPTKVVISGQSAGAGSVAAQITSPLSKGLFKAAVMMSACNFTGGGVPLAQGEAVGLDVQKRLGAKDLAALRNVPADKLLAQQAESQVGVSVQGVRAPSVIDGYFWTGTKEQAFASGQASIVPVIASSNGDDNDAGGYALTRAHTVAEYNAAAERMYGPAAPEFLKLFPVKSDADVQPMAHRAAMENGHMKASRTCGEVQAKYGQAPVYIDTFMKKHPYAPGVTFPDQDPVTVGAYHTADVPYWFDTMAAYNRFRTTRVPTAWDRQLTDAMAGTLIALAETGSPSTAQVRWPAYSTRSPQFISFGDSIAVQTMDLKRMDWLAAHPPAASAAPRQPTGPRD